MYATRPLSQLLNYPESLAAPPDGPNSGYLVIQDEESVTYSEESMTCSCIGLCKSPTLRKMPFPQDKELLVQNLYHGPREKNLCQHAVWDKNLCHHAVFLIPVLDQPLSSNRYYAIVPDGEHKGEAFISSRVEEDEATCCFCGCTNDARPRPLDPHNIYQQFEVVPYHQNFYAHSIARDGYPPHFLQQSGWAIRTRNRNQLRLETAQGLNSKLRARLPEFNLSLLWKSSKPCVVGKWYAPFIFVKEGSLQDQMRRSMYYEVTLEQRWEQIFSCRKNNCSQSSVVIDTSLEKEEVYVGRKKAVWNEQAAVDGVIWFTGNGDGGKRAGVGLRKELVERMKWEQKRGGWIDGEERHVKINKIEEFNKLEGDQWSEFGCYVLVERFNLRRMDGGLVMSYDFKHFHQIKTKWE